MKFDLQYIDNGSFLLDFKNMAKTIPSFIRRSAHLRIEFLPDS